MHTLLLAAHTAAPANARPAPPYHGGVDANPQLGSFGFGGVALFVAETAAPLVKRAERARFDGFVGVAREVYEGHAHGLGKEVKRGTKKRVVLLDKEPLKNLQKSVTLSTGFVGVDQELSPALSAAQGAAFAALDLETKSGGGYVTAALRTVVSRVVAALPPDEVRPFLVALDQRLLREELRAMLAERRDSRAAKVVACLWRAATGKARGGRASGAQVTHSIGKLDAAAGAPASASFVLVQKVGARWSVFEGSRDDILATVPDEHLESATDAVIGSTAAPATRQKAPANKGHR